VDGTWNTDHGPRERLTNIPKYPIYKT